MRTRPRASRPLPLLDALLLMALCLGGCALDTERVEGGEPLQPLQPLQPHLVLSGTTRIAAGARAALKIAARDGQLDPIDAALVDAVSADRSILSVEGIDDGLDDGPIVWLRAHDPGVTTLTVSDASSEQDRLRSASVGVEVARAETVRVEGCPEGRVLVADGAVGYELHDGRGRSLAGDVSELVRWTGLDGAPLAPTYEQGSTGDRWWLASDPRGSTLDFGAEVGDARFELVGAADVDAVEIAATSELGADAVVELAATSAGQPVCIGDPQLIVAELVDGPCRIARESHGSFRIIDAATSVCTLRFSLGEAVPVEIDL